MKYLPVGFAVDGSTCQFHLLCDRAVKICLRTLFLSPRCRRKLNVCELRCLAVVVCIDIYDQGYFLNQLFHPVSIGKMIDRVCVRDDQNIQITFKHLCCCKSWFVIYILRFPKFRNLFNAFIIKSQMYCQHGRESTHFPSSHCIGLSCKA